MSERSGHKRSSRLYAFDRAFDGAEPIMLVGIDEAGRGPLAGPVVAAAVCLDRSKPIDGVNDSKKLSAHAREELYAEIVEKAAAHGVGSASWEEIDRVNILQATFLAMRRALDAITVDWDLALVDGNRPLPFLTAEKQRTVVDGDALSASIAAASIIAKVTRDRVMAQYHEHYPEYDFLSNKGYATEHHRNVIEQRGMCDIHRRSFCSVLAMQTRLPL